MEASLSPSPLTDDAFRSVLAAMAQRNRVPRAEAEDIVQSALTEAVACESAPPDPVALRRWIRGVVRHKIVDYHRRARRESSVGSSSDLEDHAAGFASEQTYANFAPPPYVARTILRAVAADFPVASDARRTLEWLVREAEGEKLEAIAEAEHLPSPRVRQRVSRLRRHLRERWKTHLAILGVVVVVATVLAARPWPRRPSVPEVADDAPRLEERQERPREVIELRPAPPPTLPAISAPRSPSPLPSSLPSPLPSSAPSPSPSISSSPARRSPAASSPARREAVMPWTESATPRREIETASPYESEPAKPARRPGRQIDTTSPW